MDARFSRKLESLIFKLETPPVGEFTSNPSSMAAGVAGNIDIGGLAGMEVGCSHSGMAPCDGVCVTRICGDGGGAGPCRIAMEEATGWDEYLFPDGPLAKRPRR